MFVFTDQCLLREFTAVCPGGVATEAPEVTTTEQADATEAR